MKRRIPIALSLLALFCLALPVAGCQEDLGDPVIFQADWDAKAPTTDGAGTNTNNALADWQPECGPDGYYACPPYGTKRGEVIPNKIFASGNEYSDVWANEDGVFSMADYYQSEAELLFVYYGQNG